MTKPFNPGDQVKMATRLALSMASNRHCHVNWQTRRGIVHHSNNYSVFVYWDGVKSVDQLPVGAVEKA